VGISLGNNSDQIASSVERIKEVELERYIEASRKDLISDVFVKEEKEELEREEVDKLILNSLCCEIMDEVVNLGNAYPQDCIITSGHETSSSLKKSKKSRSKSKKKSSK
jgi:molecular chaperone DnaK (HSP70)